jgi:GNAT superfamily N-acetyltransferase
VIRRAGPGDGDAVAAVFVASFTTLTFLPRLHTDDELRTFIRDVVLPEQEVWVAADDGDIVGFVAMTDERLEHLYVDPRAQKRGIGSALLAQAKLRRPGGFTFWVFQANEVACRFYEARGCWLVKLTDGSGNEERTPDALYRWRPAR